MIDIGVNLATKQYKRHRIRGILKEANSHGVDGIITISNSLQEIEKNFTLVEEYHGVDEVKIWSTAGVHPHHAKEVRKPQSMIKAMHSVFNHDVYSSNFVAVGECGLDYNRNFSPPEKQKEIFVYQLQYAINMNLPVYLHERDAYSDFSSILKKMKLSHPSLRGVVHCFTGSEKEVRTYVDLGFHIGITGWVCDQRRNGPLLKALKHIPLEKLLVETDAPYLKPPAFKGRYNVPSSLPLVVERLSKEMGVDQDLIIQQTRENTAQLFQL